MTERTIPLDQIIVPEDRSRDLDPVWAEALAAMIEKQGLIHPIRLRQTVDGTFILVAGLHRLEAHRLNRAEMIRYELSAAQTEDEGRLEEVMENLGRNELIALDRCHHLYDLKQVYERMYPQTKHGAASPKTQSLRLSETHQSEPEVFGFAEAVAEQVGLSKRSIQLGVSIWANLVPESRTRLQGMTAARKQSELKQLADLSPVRQIKVLDLIEDATRPDILTVAAAVEISESGVQASKMDKRYKTVLATVSKLPDPDFDRLILDNAERVIDALKRQNRI
ncbi:MAG: ParB N-terminal domain-containing protein [Pseudomonadota bacterium]